MDSEENREERTGTTFSRSEAHFVTLLAPSATFTTGMIREMSSDEAFDDKGSVFDELPLPFHTSEINNCQLKLRSIERTKEKGLGSS